MRAAVVVSAEGLAFAAYLTLSGALRGVGRVLG